MYRIVERKLLAENTWSLKIEAPEIARKRRAGQFAILRVHERGERIPLTLADGDVEAGTVTLIFQAVGKTTCELADLEVGASLQDLVGPLGQASEVESYGTVACVGGGVGIAVVWPVARAMAAAGNRVVGIIGARSAEHLILEEEMAACCDRLELSTDDGSRGTHGFVSDVLQKLVQEGEAIDRVMAIGPVPMMRAIVNVTRSLEIPTAVSLNPIMVDGTGMCGACRVTVDGRTRFACVDGPDFDGFAVDFDELIRRLAAYRDEEAEAREPHPGPRCDERGSR